GAGAGGLSNTRPRAPARGYHASDRITFSARSRAHELRVQLDLRASQRLRNRAALLGAVGELLELRLVDAGDGGFGLELDARDLEAFADLQSAFPNRVSRAGGHTTSPS